MDTKKEDGTDSSDNGKKSKKKERPKASIEIPRPDHIHHNNPEIFRDGWISCMLCGKSGCGKTSLMAELVPSVSDKIKFICIATMVYRNPFHLALQEWARKTKRICVINDDPQKIRFFVTQLHRTGWLVPGDKELLLIFDDFSINGRSGSKPENLVVEAFTRWRNLGVNIIIVCQDASMVATSCRNCTNMRALFNSASRSALWTFGKDVMERIPDQSVYNNLIRYISSTPFSYILVQENPLEVSIGKGLQIRKVMTGSSVSVPTYRELMREIGANSPEELEKMSTEMQKKMGNTAPELSDSNPERRKSHHRDGESDSGDSDSE